MLRLLVRQSYGAVQGCSQQCLRQMSVCNLHMLQASQAGLSTHEMRHFILPYTAPESFNAAKFQAFQISTRHLHKSSSNEDKHDSFTSQGPTSTHVFRIKTRVKVPKKEGMFSIGGLLSTPAPYMLYGLGGLIPFMFPPYHMHVIGAFSPFDAHAQLVYGACILSFLGGVSWGDHLRRSEKASLRSLSYSIILPLVAWPAVLLFPNPSSFVLMIGGITFAGMKDARSDVYPRWFRSLRFLLTSLVALSLSTTLVFSLTKEEQKENKEG